MNLQIDVGNTFLKWRVLDAGNVVSRGREFTSGQCYFEGLSLWGEINAISVASVASQQVLERLLTIFGVKCPGTKPFIAVTQREFEGVLCSYEDPVQMGVDRWLAVVAGYLKYKDSCCVVDCGSAITVDVVDFAGRHLGGYILPGLGLMKKSLSSGTERVLFSDEEDGNLDYGESTSECVQNGIAFMVGAFFDGLTKRLRDEGVRRLMVTGGDAEYVASLSSDTGVSLEIEQCPDLVLDGLSFYDGIVLD